MRSRTLMQPVLITCVLVFMLTVFSETHAYGDENGSAQSAILPGASSTGNATEHTAVTGSRSNRVQPLSQYSLRQLIGIRVINPLNEEIGHIADFVVDANGRIREVIVLVDDIFGFGGHRVSLPFADIALQNGNEASGHWTAVIRRTKADILKKSEVK